MNDSSQFKPWRDLENSKISALLNEASAYAPSDVPESARLRMFANLTSILPALSGTQSKTEARDLPKSSSETPQDLQASKQSKTGLPEASQDVTPKDFFEHAKETSSLSLKTAHVAGIKASLLSKSGLLLLGGTSIVASVLGVQHSLLKEQNKKEESAPIAQTKTQASDLSQLPPTLSSETPSAFATPQVLGVLETEAHEKEPTLAPPQEPSSVSRAFAANQERASEKPSLALPSPLSEPQKPFGVKENEPSFETAENDPSKKIENEETALKEQKEERPSSPAVASEFELLSKARQQKKANPKEAESLLKQHRALYPMGTLREEREALWIEVLFLENRSTEARSLAQAWLLRNPENPFSERLKELMLRKE